VPATNPLVFYCLAALTLVSAVLVVGLRNIFYSGMCLVVTFLGVAGLYLLLNAEFVAAIQILIYVGAVTVLLIFAIMMTHRLMDHKLHAANRLEAPALGLALVLAVLLAMVAARTSWPLSTQEIGTGIINRIGHLLMGKFLLPFELVSVVLLGALIGALVIARKEDKQ